MTLQFIDEKEKLGSLIKTYESEYYQFQITLDLSTGYETAYVKSLVRNTFLPMITVSKIDGAYAVEMSTSGRGGLSVDDGKEIIKYMRVASDTVMDIEKLLNIG